MSAQAIERQPKCSPRLDISVETLMYRLSPRIPVEWKNIITNFSAVIGDRFLQIDHRNVFLEGNTLRFFGFIETSFNLRIQLEPAVPHPVTWTTSYGAEWTLHVPHGYSPTREEFQRWLVGHTLHPLSGDQASLDVELRKNEAIGSGPNALSSFLGDTEQGLLTPISEIREYQPRGESEELYERGITPVILQPSNFESMIALHRRYIDTARHTLVLCPSTDVAEQMTRAYRQAFPEIESEIVSLRRTANNLGRVRQSLQSGGIRVLVITPEQYEHLAFPGFDAWIDMYTNSSIEETVHRYRRHAAPFDGRRKIRLLAMGGNPDFLAAMEQAGTQRRDALFDQTRTPTRAMEARGVAVELWQFSQGHHALPRSSGRGVPSSEIELYDRVRAIWRSPLRLGVALTTELNAQLAASPTETQRLMRRVLAQFLGNSRPEIVADLLFDWIVTHLETRHPTPRYAPGRPDRRQEHALASRVAATLSTPDDAQIMRDRLALRLEGLDEETRRRVGRQVEVYDSRSRTTRAADDFWTWATDPAHRANPIPRTRNPQGEPNEGTLRRHIDTAYSDPERRIELRERLLFHLQHLESAERASILPRLGRYATE